MAEKEKNSYPYPINEMIERIMPEYETLVKFHAREFLRQYLRENNNLSEVIHKLEQAQKQEEDMVKREILVIIKFNLQSFLVDMNRAQDSESGRNQSYRQ